MRACARVWTCRALFIRLLGPVAADVHAGEDLQVALHLDSVVQRMDFASEDTESLQLLQCECIRRIRQVMNITRLQVCVCVGGGGGGWERLDCCVPTHPFARDVKGSSDMNCVDCFCVFPCFALSGWGGSATGKPIARCGSPHHVWTGPLSRPHILHGRRLARVFLGTWH